MSHGERERGSWRNKLNVVKISIIFLLFLFCLKVYFSVWFYMARWAYFSLYEEKSFLCFIKERMKKEWKEKKGKTKYVFVYIYNLKIDEEIVGGRLKSWKVFRIVSIWDVHNINIIVEFWVVV